MALPTSAQADYTCLVDVVNNRRKLCGVDGLRSLKRQIRKEIDNAGTAWTSADIVEDFRRYLVYLAENDEKELPTEGVRFGLTIRRRVAAGCAERLSASVGSASSKERLLVGCVLLSIGGLQDLLADGHGPGSALFTDARDLALLDLSLSPSGETQQ
jgi:hypothetical protein